MSRMPAAVAPRLAWPAAAMAVLLAAAVYRPVSAAAGTTPGVAAPHVTAVSATSGSGARRPSPYVGAQHLAHADINYALQWGVDSMQVHETNAGNLIRFSYRVVDANKAKPLIDKGASPMMVAPRLNVALQVPVMDKIGPLRQSTEVEPGKVYWMVFSNKGQLVKRGERVSVWVGGFRVDGLVVQ